MSNQTRVAPTALSIPSCAQRLAQRGKWFSILFPMLLALLAMGTTPGLRAQGITGSIAGTVTDSNAYVVPGATVTITQIDTNSVHTVITGDDGNFKVTQLPPGHYSVTAEKFGFKLFKQSDITLQIDQVLEVDPQLQLGSQKETIVVTSAPPVIQTDDSSVGSVIDSESIQNTPLNGRLSVIGLIALAPGVQGAGAQDQAAVRGVTPSIGTGSRNAYGGFGNTLDGVMNKEVTLQRAEAEIPSLDALDQFKVITTGAPAEFNEPAQVIVVSKSGGNTLHGELLEYNRSKGTSAKSYSFLPPASALARAPYQRNEYGGNLSGPIYIPHVWNGKDQSFFFFAFEGFHLNQASPLNTQQPTVAWRNGDFSSLTTKVIDPTTGKQFPGNVIPSARFNSVDQILLKDLYPLPTTTSTGTNTFELVNNTSEVTRYSVRLDHKINDANQLRFTFLRAFYGPNPDSEVDSKQGGYSGDGEHNTNMILGWTHAFSPSLLLDTYGDFFHLPIYRTPQNSKVDFASIIPELGPVDIEGAPTISITNITGVSESGSKDLEQVVQLNSNLTKVLSKHTLKAGFNVLYDDHWNESCGRGTYNFNGQYTGNAFADFLLGDPSSTSNNNINCPISRNQNPQYGAFIEDDWKPIPKLTVNAGLRYDLQWFQPSIYGKNALYVPSLQKIVVFGNSLSQAIPAFLGKVPVVLASSVGISSNPFSYLGRPNKNFAPRLGFAYQVFPNTVVRGAAGIYFNLLPGSYVYQMYNNLPFLAGVTYNQPSGPTPSFTMNDPFSATGAFSANPGVTAQHSLETPYTEEYNLAIEHQFGKGIDLRVGYVGQHNVKQNNASGPGTTTPNLNLANPPVIGVTSQTTNLVQPFAAINLATDPIFHSTENSLQIGLHKRFNDDFSVNAEYQWTRVLGTENIENPSGASLNDSYGPIGGITPQVLTLNYLYALPMGQGKALFGTSTGLVNKILSGWEWSGVTTFQTGQPFSVTYTAPGSPKGQVSGRANVVPGVAFYPKHKTNAEWFNPAAFVAPPCYNAVAVGTCSSIYIAGGPTTYATYGDSGYDMLRGPGWQNWDMNLEKNLQFHDHYRLLLRADSFNIFNHPNFSTPNSAISNAATAGTITSTAGTPNYEQRTVEFAAKFNF